EVSHGRTLFALTGSRVREALAKGVPIDLHASVFRPGDAASTLVAHIPVNLWQVAHRPGHEFAIARGLAARFLPVVHAAARRVRPAIRGRLRSGLRSCSPGVGGVQDLGQRAGGPMGAKLTGPKLTGPKLTGPKLTVTRANSIGPNAFGPRSIERTSIEPNHG